MRIAFYAPMKPPTHGAPSGDRRMARLLFKALKGAGHAVELASRFRSFEGAGDMARQKTIRDRGQRLATRLIEKYRGQSADRRPQIWFTYHLYHKAPDWLGPEVARALAIPYVAAEASHAPKQAGGPWSLGFEAAQAAIGQARVIFNLSSEDAVCLAPVIAPEAQMIALKPFIEIAPYARATSGRAMRRAEIAAELGIDPAAPWLLTVAMMRPGDKLASYRLLGAALESLPNCSWQLLVVGDGPARDAVEAALAPLGGRVAFLGELAAADLRSIYVAADLYVWPGLNEAYGMALLEAQASGLPVVAGRTGGVPDVVSDGETGRLVAAGDQAAFAEAVASLIDDGPCRMTLAAGAAQIAARDHDIAAAARILDRGFREALR
jgi:glycosyltransferase involved in cell wall biosynthesis